jgi:hypothetical protein
LFARHRRNRPRENQVKGSELAMIGGYERVSGGGEKYVGREIVLLFA